MNLTSIHLESAFAHRIAKYLRSTDDVAATSVYNLCLEEGLYSKVMRSIAFELEIPFLFQTCWKSAVVLEFPYAEKPEFKKAVLERSGVSVNGLTESELNQEFNNHYPQASKETILSCIPDPLRSLVEVAAEKKFSKKACKAYPLVAETIKNIGEKLNEYNNGVATSFSMLENKLYNFDNAAYEWFAPVHNSLRDLIFSSWETHYYFLMDAMSCFERRSRRGRVGGMLFFDGVPEEIVRGYYQAFDPIKDLAGDLADVIARKIDYLSAINVLEDRKIDGLIDAINVRMARYHNIHASVCNFRSRTAADERSLLMIGDISLTGFLKYPFPPL